MPIIANQNVYTLTQWANSLGPDHMIQTRVANLLEQQNGVIADAGWIESNMPLGHMGEVQVGLPASYYAAMNGFVGVSQDAVMPIQEPAAMLKAFTQVSKEMGELGGMGELAKLRARKSKAQLESFNQQFTKTLFYGSAVNPASFVGLSTRYSSLEATNGQNILDAGGTSGTNASIWRRLPYVVRSAVAGLEQTPVDLELANRNLGASTFETMRRITGPLIAANLIAGGLLAFAFAMLEVSDSLILAQRQSYWPITRAIYDLFQRLGDGPYVASALGVWAMLLLMLTMLSATRC